MFIKKLFLFTGVLTTATLAVFCFFTTNVYAFDCDELDRVHINSASQEELECLDGIASTLSKGIIDNRPFSSLDDLERVSRIGEVTVAKIKEQGLATVEQSDENSEEEDNETEEELEEDDQTEEQQEEDSETEEQEKEDEKVYSYSSPVEISIIKEVSFVKIGAGRDRKVSVESDVLFRVYLEDESEVSRLTEFEWVLGDGSVKKGREITHQYFVPGVYNVVLTVKSGREEAVSYIEVEVIEPKVTIKEANERFVSIFNSSEGDINLGDWQIESKDKTFSIPNNTIVKKGKEVILPKQVTGIEVSSDDKVKLKSPSGNFDSFYTDTKEEEALSQDELPSEVDAVTKENEILERELSLLREEVNRLVTIPKVEEKEKFTDLESSDEKKELSVKEETEKDLEKSESEVVYEIEDSKDDLVKVIYESDESKKGIWRRLLGTPSLIFDKLPF